MDPEEGGPGKGPAPVSITGSKSDVVSTDGEAMPTPDPTNSSSSSPADIMVDVAVPTSDKRTTVVADAPLSSSGDDDPSLKEAAAPLVDTPAPGATSPSRDSPLMSRHPSFSGSSSYQEDWESFPPLDRLTVLDLLDNFALSARLEKLSRGISAQTQKVRRSREALKSRSQVAKEAMVDQWRRRVPTAEEQLQRYRKRMRTSVEKLGRQWNDTKVITLREKVSFICAVMNIFISGYLMGAFPEYFHIWYSVQLLYFMPIRVYTYHRRGYHYFLVDLCYFVNLLVMLSIWVFPSSRRLFMAAYCLAHGNNAVAIVMWRNSLVFHSFDKVLSLFIHIMPCATLHCIVHLLSPESQAEKFPGIWAVKNSPPGSPGAYGNIVSMLAWSTIPYLGWQLMYYVFITIRRREKIQAGRPTSFTWLRKSYSKVWIGKFVLSLPMALQEPAFMVIQYIYAVLTMIPCSIWFYYRYASACFLMVVFTWSVYNGATFYIDVFGKRFQRELEAMRSEVAKWQTGSDLISSPTLTPTMAPSVNSATVPFNIQMSAPVTTTTDGCYEKDDKPSMYESEKTALGSEDYAAMSEDFSSEAEATGVDLGAKEIARERKSVLEAAG